MILIMEINTIYSRVSRSNGQLCGRERLELSNVVLCWLVRCAAGAPRDVATAPSIQHLWLTLRFYTHMSRSGVHLLRSGERNELRARPPSLSLPLPRMNAVMNLVVQVKKHIASLSSALIYTMQSVLDHALSEFEFIPTLFAK